MKSSHKKILDNNMFEFIGTVEQVISSDEFDNLRVVYAITDPKRNEIVYIGHSEKGRNLRGRLKSHLKDREKIGAVENKSHVYMHLMITEYSVLGEFEDKHGCLPKLNKKKSQIHPKFS